MSSLCKNCVKVNIIDLCIEPDSYDEHNVKWKQEWEEQNQSITEPSLHIARDFIALEDSAQNGCRFCAFVWQSIAMSENVGNVAKHLEKEIRIHIDWNSGWSIDETDGSSWINWPEMVITPWDVHISVMGEVENNDSKWGPKTTTPMPVDPRSESINEQSQKWISDCMQNHKSCSSNQSTMIPPRLIDLGTDDQSSHACLIEPDMSKDTSEYKSYVTLSYCWGDTKRWPHHVTYQTNYKDRLESFPLSILPATIRDAVDTTRRLGRRYIWIDSLCIIQDDPIDVNKNIGLMQSIYKNAACAISAMDSKHATEGMLHPRTYVKFGGYSFKIPLRPRKVEKPWYEKVFPQKQRQNTLRQQLLDSIIPKKHLDCEPEYYPRQRRFTFSITIGESNLETRGWTFQERLLSPRRLCFSYWGVFWECHELTASELFPDGFRQKGNGQQLMGYFYHDTRAGPIDIVGQDWRDLMEEASQRRLTNPNDRLKSLAGVAEEYHARRLPGDTYLAGLWKRSIIFDLCWAGAPWGTPQKDDDALRWDPSETTWSWAAQRRRNINWPRWYDYSGSSSKGRNLAEVAHLINENIVPVSELNPYGDLSRGRLTLEGWLGPFDPDPFPPPCSAEQAGGLNHGGRMVCLDRPWPGGNLVKVMPLLKGTRNDEPLIENNIPVSGSVPLQTHYALLLMPAEKEVVQEGESMCWRRIGICRTAFDEDFRFCEWRSLVLI